MKSFWIIVAGLAVVAAALFAVRNDFDKAFVIAALGAVAWFLSYRVQMKELTNPGDEHQSTNGYDENDDD